MKNETKFGCRPCLLLLFVCAMPVSVTIAQETIEISLVVQVIEQADVPALETGIIQSLSVREGDRVRSGGEIGRLDDRQAKLQAKLSASDLAIATEQSQNFTGIESAERNLAQQQQLSDQQRVIRRIAERKSENDVGVQVAKKTTAAAKNELQRAATARDKFADSVSKSELDSLRLVLEKSELETQQATFQRELDKLSAESEEKGSLLHILKVDQARVGLKQAKSDAKITQLQTETKFHLKQLADLQVERRKIVSSLDGVVVQRYKRSGDWVRAGDPIVRVMNLSRLRGEGFTALSLARKLKTVKKVTLSCDLGDGVVEREGEVMFVSPEVMVDGKVRVLVEFDNPLEDVLPGTSVLLKSTLP